MAQLTPMMQQYMGIKNQYKDCILFYRIGDFYEMFFEDAITASKELEITLTGKDCGQEERAPMCGVPYHAVDGYLSKLVSKGYRVAICEQTVDPKSCKGLVEREVIRIVTPGTNLNTQVLDESKNNYLCSIVYTTNSYGISFADVTTGDFYVTEVDTERKLLDEIGKFSPSEIICNDAFLVSGADIDELKNRYQISIEALEPWYFDDDLCKRSLMEQFSVSSLDGLGLGDYSIGVIAAGAIMQYLHETQKTDLTHITGITPYITSKFMLLDSSTRRNLELVETLREKQKRGSLLWVLDKTKTAMGARLLRNYIEQPLIDKDDIEVRLNGIVELNENMIIREELREYLNPIYDLERLMGKISYKSANPRDLTAFRMSLEMLPHISYLMKDMKSDLMKMINEELDPLTDLCDLVKEAIDEEPPLTMKEGGIIKDGFNEQVDKLRHAKTEGKNWLMELESKEKEATGIKNLKIKFNKVFGYYFEVTNSYKDLVPENWIRKQTLANAERYTTQELKELEDVILGAEDKLTALEYELYCQVRDTIASQVARIKGTAKAVAKVDVFTSLAYVADHNGFVKPQINEDGVIEIKEGRHPVVEKMINHDMFVANDTYLDNKEKRVSIITGPNMAGKSTYMRQTALIVLMAQIGSFVPAKQANIGIVDRIFTRVGASDDLASGQSTFMVEMTEVANILRNATKDSLLILDEIGRGTSTFDGLSIAWAVVEHISNPKLLGAKTLFATHYHELTELEGKLESVNNYCIAVKEQGEDIVFLRKIIPGGADKSYGIQVAKIAGVPESVLKRAREIAEQLNKSDLVQNSKLIEGYISEGEDSKKKGKTKKDKTSDGNFHQSMTKEGDSVDGGQLSLFDTPNHHDDVIQEIETLDLMNTTPMEALNLLYKLQTKCKSRR